jgi:N-carbamoylputrescine amidase
VNVAVAQLTTEPYEADANRALTVETARDAFERGADLVVLPELAIPGYVADRERLEPLAEPADGPTCEAWRELAKQAGGVIVGGFCEAGPSGIYNAAIAVGPDGLLLHYRKVHPFATEKLTFLPGDLGFPVAKTPFGTLGICVCYDLRFVEVVRLMALRDAELICVPTAWVAGYDQQRWDERGLCPQAHAAILQANLSQVFIACASQAGSNGETEFLGSSIVADPWGKLTLGPLSGTEDETAIAEIDLADAGRARIRGPLITPREDRRTDVYGIWAAGQVL